MRAPTTEFRSLGDAGELADGDVHPYYLEDPQAAGRGGAGRREAVRLR